MRNQLLDMAAGGQKQIALMLWHMPIDTAMDGDGDGVYGHVVDSSSGQLRAQHQANLVALLADIRCAGFNKLYFRFAVQGGVDPSAWRSWNEDMFQSNWNFLHQTRSLVDAQMLGSGIEVIYDLAAELGGITSGQARAYTKKLWQNVTYVFGTTSTYGFSFATAPGRLTEIIAVYDETGTQHRRQRVGDTRLRFRRARRGGRERRQGSDSGDLLQRCPGQCKPQSLGEGARLDAGIDLSVADSAGRDDRTLLHGLGCRL